MSNQKFNFATPLHLATSDDELRPVMQCVWFNDGFAYASDSHVLVKQSIEMSTIMEADKLNGHCLHRSSFKDIMKYQYATATDEGVDCTGKKGDKAFYPYHDGIGEMPSFEKVLDDILSNDPEATNRVGLSSPSLVRVSKALGCGRSGLTLSFRGYLRGVVVSANDSEAGNQIGLIMPITPSND
jgi:hypothetical protein